nr:M56 family metallopeptidase [uncultured Sulfurimonas sp.]
MKDPLVLQQIMTVSNLVVLTGLNLFVQSTIILLTGLAIDRLICKKGAAVQSVVLRFFLVAVLLGPFASTGFRYFGINLVTMKIPGLPAYYSSSHESTSLYGDDISQKRTVSGIETELPIARGNELPPPENVHHEKKGNRIGEQHVSQIPAEKPVEVLKSENSQVIIHALHQKNVTESAQEYNPGNNGARGGIIAQEHSNNRIDFIPWLYLAGTVLWIVSSSVLAFKLLGASLYVFYMRRTIFPAKPCYRKMCKILAGEVGVKPPEVLQSPYIKTPLLAGVFRPVIIMPISSDENSYPSREILLHELSHLKRHDTFWNYLRQLGVTVLPFQPLLWILSRRIEETSDFVCDDFVLQHSANQKNYAVGLARMALRYFPENTGLSIGAGFISVTSSLKRRISRILDTTRRISLIVSARTVFNVSFLCAFTTFVSGLIGIKGNNMIHESYASETKPGEDKKKTAFKAYETGKTAQNKFAEANHDKKSPVSQNSDIIQGKRPDNETIPGSVNTKQADIKENMTRQDFGNEKNYAAMPLEYTQPAHDEAEPDFSGTIGKPITGIIPGEEYVLVDSGMESNVGQQEEISAETIPEETGNNIKIAENEETAEAFVLTSHIDFEMTGSTALSNNDISELGMTALDIIISYDYENVDRNDSVQRKLADIYGSLSSSKMYPVWSPDGDKIAFNDKEYGIWLVDANGGEPELLYENYYSLKFGNYHLHYGGLQTIGFSPDGEEIAFLRYEIDTEWGTSVKLDETGLFYTIEYPMPVIESVNITSGETRVLSKGGITGCWSRSGKYFAYITQDMNLGRKLWLHDLDTGEIRKIECLQPSKVRFSEDDSTLYISEQDEDNIRRVSRISLLDGDTEIVPLPENSSLADVSADGRRILFVDWSANLQQFIFDMQTGEIIDVFPSEKYSTTWGMFSPDGTKICLNFLESYQGEPVWKMYIHDLDLPAEKATDIDADIPVPFALKGNFPNPFNMATTIDYSVPESGYVSLTVYNITGQKVRELVAQDMDAGIHHVLWDGRDDRGEKVSSGTYLTTLTAGNQVKMHKMMMVK